MTDGTFQSGHGEAYFGRLVHLQARSPDNQINGQFRINLTLEVYRHELSIDLPSKSGGWRNLWHTQNETAAQKLDLIISLSKCLVEYREADLTILADTKYRCEIQQGTYQEAKTVKQTSGRKTGVQVEGAAGGKAGLIGASISVSADAKGRYTNDSSQTADTKITQKREIYEVNTIGNAWLVEGWPVPDSGERQHLLGRYFGRQVEAYPQTCVAEFRPGATAGSLTFTVSAPRDGLVVERAADPSPATKDEKMQAIAAMTDSIAAIKIEKHLSALEMPLFSLKCTASRAIVSDDTATAPGPNAAGPRVRRQTAAKPETRTSPRKTSK